MYLYLDHSTRDSRTSDLFIRRWFVIIGPTLSLVGCIISTFATSIPMLVEGTALIGFAAAVQLSFPSIVGELVPIKYRFTAMSFISSYCSPFACFGPVMSYALVQHGSWRSVYYLFIGINGITLICFYF
jgi:MFS family permease